MAVLGRRPFLLGFGFARPDKQGSVLLEFLASNV